MKDFLTFKRIAMFLGIIGIGIIGLIIADQQDYLSGRTDGQASIGNGEADPLIKDVQLTPSKSNKTPPTNLDGKNTPRTITPEPCGKKVC